MYIKNVTIKNFRNFSDFSISFTKGFQTIIGENNIGKSNLYWAIRLVLDTDLSYKNRILEEKDFHGFQDLKKDSFILISIDFYGENLSSFPYFHAIKTSDNTARVTYLFAHKSVLKRTKEEAGKIEIKDFNFCLYGGGDSHELEKLVELNSISHKELEGINLFYITAYRNISADLHGSSKSLLSQYCNSRTEAEKEQSQIKEILTSSSNELNKLEFIPDIAQKVKDKNSEIVGKYFSFPVSIGFLSEFESDFLNQLNLFYNPDGVKNIPLYTLGLGQKNILYLSLFLSKLINEHQNHELNILLIEEPEAHLHPQLQKLLFSNLQGLSDTQVFMTSHSTHIASDCEYKNLNVLYKNTDGKIKSFSPFATNLLLPREQSLLKRYIDATRSEIFFASGIILVEGMSEQFLIPSIAKKIFNLNLNEYNISIVPICSRFFDPYLKLFQPNNLELFACAIIDGDKPEVIGEGGTTAVENAKKLRIEKRVEIFVGTNTLEIDIFPDKQTNKKYLELCFTNLGHKQSFENLMGCDPEKWNDELIKRIEGTVQKGRFAQELAQIIDKDFVIPQYIKNAITFIIKSKKIKV